MRPEAIASMLPFLSEVSANPSGSHGASRAAKNALEEARETVASILGASTREVVFTGGGSGGVDLDALAAALDEGTVVVSVMLVNNETGVVQPLADVAALVRERAPNAVL